MLTRTIKFAFAGLVISFYGHLFAADSCLEELKNIFSDLEGITKHQPFFIITGAPSTGKSTTLASLASKDNDFVTYSEIAAEIIKERQARGIKCPWEDVKFNADILAGMKEQLERAALNRSVIHIFDRGPIDPLAYDIDATEKIDAGLVEGIKSLLGKNLYNQTVFVFAPLPSRCFENTEYRPEDRERSLFLDQWLRRVYAAVGFTVVDVPYSSIEERIDFITQQINNQLYPIA